MEITQEQIGAVHVLAPAGRLDTDSSIDLELAINDLIAADARNFVIDFSAIGYVSSAGLRVLLMTAKQFDGGKGTLRLCGLNDQVRQVFDIAGFSKLFQIFADRAAALDKPPAKPTGPPAAPGIGKLASQLMGVQSREGKVDPGRSAMADDAARLLGAKPLAKSKKGSTPPPAQGVSRSERAKALESLQTPQAPPAPESEPAPDEDSKGTMDRLRDLFRK